MTFPAEVSPARAFARSDEAKCAGIGCDDRGRCGRYLRPEAKQQSWCAFYALLPECGGLVPVKIEMAA